MKKFLIVVLNIAFLTVNAQDSKEKAASRDVFALGYQIGGYNLLGFDIEKRVSNVIGLHVGAGFVGYTGGVKIHTGPKKDAPFFNVSYKDGGMGLLKVVAYELGGRFLKSKVKERALHVQFGVAKILQVEREFGYALFKTYDVPEYVLSFGVGLSW